MEDNANMGLRYPVSLGENLLRDSPFPSSAYFEHLGGRKFSVGSKTEAEDLSSMLHIFQMSHVFKIISSIIGAISVFMINLFSLGTFSNKSLSYQPVNVKCFSQALIGKNYFIGIYAAIYSRFQYSSLKVKFITPMVVCPIKAAYATTTTYFVTICKFFNLNWLPLFSLHGTNIDGYILLVKGKI